MPQPFTTHLDTLQRRIGQELFARVAGPEGPANRERFRKSGPRWFTDDRPIRRVHGDAAMFVGGLRALLLQSLHPLAMIAVAQHSDYREDPWGRLQRTSTFLAATTYGTVEDAQRAVDRVRRVHEHVTGITPDGRSYRAADPHLLRWVHVAETDSFLRCHQRYGARPLDEAGCDGYVADTARIAIELGVPDPPRTRATSTRRCAPTGPSCAAARKPARPPGSWCGTRRCHCWPAARTRCWRRPRSANCRPGPGANCDCPPLPGPMPCSCGRPAMPSSGRSAG